jgi:hypothetical protein
LVTFGKFGTVVDAFVAMDRHAVSRGFGFVTFEHLHSASAAIDGAKGQKIDCRTIRVNFAGQRAAPALLTFRDHFAGTTESLSLSHIPLLPDEQAALAQVTRPLHLMRAAASAASHESCSVVPWAAIASSRTPAHPAAAAAAPRLPS